MKRLLRVGAIVVVYLGSFLCASSSLATCHVPPSEPESDTWTHMTLVSVTFDPNLNKIVGNATGPISTAISNWNSATSALCRTPVFSLESGGGETMSFAYAVIPNKADGTPVRGRTILTSATRLTSAVSTINSNIPITFPNVLTEVIAHEMGHTMGLNDCYYNSGCPISSTVMVSGSPVPTWTGIQGLPGPNACDILVVETTANDYQCCTVTTCPSHLGCPCNSPVVLDVDGKGFHLTSAANGVLFDITGSGQPIQLAWTASGSNNAFLALPGEDGLVHNGKQLFGNFTPQPPSETPNGYAALAVYDEPDHGGNGDGVIDSRDSIFKSLRLWIDSNHDGICQPSELHTLPSLGVNSLSLRYRETKKTDQYGNLFRYEASVNPDDRNVSSVDRRAYDVFLVTDASITRNLLPSPLQQQARSCTVPAKKEGLLSVVPSGGL